MSANQPVINEVGDLVLTTTAMRALADPTRLRIWDLLSRGGRQTTEALAESIGTQESEIADHLEAMFAGGLLLDDDDGHWQAVAKGLFFEVPIDPGGQEAARELTRVMFLGYEDRPRRWIEEQEPLLEPEWWQAAGLFNAAFLMTADELRQVQVDIESLLAPYLRRTEGDAPTSSRKVRMLAYFLPPPA